MVFKQIGEDTDKLTKRIGLFSKSFSDIKKDLSNGLNIRQGLFSFVTDQDIKSLNEFNKAINNGAKYSDAFDTYLSKCPISVKRQANELIKLNTQQKILNQQLNTGKIKEEEYETAMAANRVQTQALTTQTQTLTFAQKASAVASRVMGTALKTALNIGLMLAINAIISGITQLVNRQEEAKQKAEELRQKAIENAEAAKEELNKISDLISQYEKFKDVTSLTADDKETLKSIQDELVKTFDKESKGIDLVNGEYREQLGLLQGIKQEKANQNINALISSKDIAKEAKNTNQKNEFEYFSSEDGGWKGYFESGLVDIVESLTQKFPEFSYQTFSSGTTADTLKSAKIYLSEDLNAEEKVQALQEALEYMRAEGYTDNELFRYFSNIQQHYQEEVDNYNNALKDLAQGYIDAFEPLKDDATLKEFNEWKDKLLESIDDEEVKSATSELVDSLYKETSSVPNNTTILNLDKVSEDAKNALSEYEDKISDFLSEKDKIDSALKEQEENGSISASTAFELSKSGYKSAVKYDSETKAYKLLRSEINKTAESRIAETKAKLESEKASAIQSIKDETENWRKNTGRTKDDIMYLDKLDKNKVVINEISDAYDLYIRMLEYADEGTSEYADSISKVNEELERQKTEIEKLDSGQSTIDKAIEEQKEFGHLSASSIKALHEAGLGMVLAYNEATGETTLLIDSVEELYKAMIKAQEEAAKISLNNLATEIEEIENRLNNFSVNSAGDTQKKASLESDLAEKKNQYDTQNQNIQVLSSLNFQFNSTVEDSAEEAKEEYIKAIKEAFDKEKSNLDYYLDMDMITQEEYYNQLGQLNEKYFKGKEDFLDEYRQYEVEIYKGLKQIQEEQINNIKEAFDKEKSELDHLNSMNAISQEEYYNRLFDLNEKYFKGKTELLDEYRQYEEEVYKGLKETQIKAIQEQIDALKSVNEEKQEEIDLEKAKQALENAKRNKTISVYDSERGWIRETDRNAIDSAQKEYDDLVLNEQVEVLENLIDAIENGTNTSHNLDESVNAFEQVNNLGQRVISGNVDLTQLFSGAVANRMNEIQNSINSNIPIALANQFDKSISSDSYTTNNNNTITLNGVTVMANNPEEFIAQMEDIANERFKENFPSAMNQFGRDLKRYQMNHSF